MQDGPSQWRRITISLWQRARTLFSYIRYPNSEQCQRSMPTNHRLSIPLSFLSRTFFPHRSLSRRSRLFRLRDDQVNIWRERERGEDKKGARVVSTRKNRCVDKEQPFKRSILVITGCDRYALGEKIHCTWHLGTMVILAGYKTFITRIQPGPFIRSRKGMRAWHSRGMTSRRYWFVYRLCENRYGR